MQDCIRTSVLPCLPLIVLCFLQINLLLQFSVSHDNFVSAISKGVHQNQSETWDEVFSWLSILWKRGFCHDNPQGIDVLLA